MKLEIAEKRRFNVKIILLASCVILNVLIGKLNDRFAFLSFENPAIGVLLTFLFSLPLIFIMAVGKNYKSVGYVKFLQNFLLIEYKSEKNELEYQNISSIGLDCYGTAGDLIAPWAGGIIGAYGKDGSGNHLQIHYADHEINLNIVFESAGDLNGFKTLLKRISREHNFDLEMNTETSSA